MGRGVLAGPAGTGTARSGRVGRVRGRRRWVRVARVGAARRSGGGTRVRTYDVPVSNAESDPAELVCAASSPAAGVEVLDPRDVPLGGPRAMAVRRTLPQRGRSLIGAWCFVDHYGPDDVSATGGMSFLLARARKSSGDDCPASASLTLTPTRSCCSTGSSACAIPAPSGSATKAAHATDNQRLIRLAP